METKSESKYERLRKIGIGSYGVVFKCINRQTGHIVAIKRYSENDSDPVIRKIAMREVRMLRQLKHPNLINLIEVFRRKRRLHLVFDYCELTVLDVIEKYDKNCPLNLIKKIVWQTVNGIDYCHSRNCIHRDIKPENILINQSGVVKLCDFGFARNINNNNKLFGHATSAALDLRNRQPVASSQDHRWQPESNGHTDSFGHQSLTPMKTREKDNNNNSGSSGGSSNKENVDEIAGCLNFAGSPSWAADRQAMTEYVATRWYRAPELLIGEIYYDTKIDIWAIGCVTAELMRGEPIWPGKSDLDQLCIIKNSLGQLTISQTHTLLTQSIYDQANIERLLSVSQSIGDSLERKLPPRVGQAGIEFVLACLQMDPARRPSSSELLKHSYIHSSRMAQFLKEETPANAAQAQTLALAASGSLTAANGRHLSMADSIGSHQFDQVGGIYGANSDCLLAASGARTNSQSLQLAAASSSGSPTKQRQPLWHQHHAGSSMMQQQSLTKTSQVANSNLPTNVNVPSSKQVTSSSLLLQPLSLRKQQHHQHVAAGAAKSTSSSTSFGSLQLTASSSSSSQHAKRKQPTINGHANGAANGDYSTGANSLSTGYRFSPSSSSSSQSSQLQSTFGLAFETTHGKSLVPIAEATSPPRSFNPTPARQHHAQVNSNSGAEHVETLDDASARIGNSNVKRTTAASLTPKHQRSPTKTLSRKHSQSNGNLLRIGYFDQQQQQQLASSSKSSSKQATSKGNKQHGQKSPVTLVGSDTNNQLSYSIGSPSHYNQQRAAAGQASSSSELVSGSNHKTLATTPNSKTNADANQSMLSMSSTAHSDSLEASKTLTFLPSVGVGNNKQNQQALNSNYNQNKGKQQDSSSLAAILVPI